MKNEKFTNPSLPFQTAATVALSPATAAGSKLRISSSPVSNAEVATTNWNSGGEAGAGEREEDGVSVAAAALAPAPLALPLPELSQRQKVRGQVEPRHFGRGELGSEVPSGDAGGAA